MLTAKIEDHYPESSNTADLKQPLPSATETGRLDTQKSDLETKTLAGNALLQS